jgi:MFS family permease
LLLIEGGQAWPWLSAQTLALALITLVCLAIFVRVERSATEPVLPLDLFRVRIITVSSIAMFFAGALMMAVTFEVPLFVQGVLGLDALHGGLALAPMTLGWPLAATFSGRLAIRFGYRSTALSGMLLNVVGIALLLLLTPHSSFGAVSAYSFLIGVGLGLSSTPLLIAVQSAVTWARRGVATATNMFVRSFGSVVGLAVMGALVNSATSSTSSATNHELSGSAQGAISSAVLRHIQDALMNGIHAAFVAALVAAVLGLLATWYLPGGSASLHAAREQEPE